MLVFRVKATLGGLNIRVEFDGSRLSTNARTESLSTVEHPSNLGILELHRPNPEGRVLKGPGGAYVVSTYALSNKHCVAAVLGCKKSEDKSINSKVCRVGSRCSGLISLSSLKKQDSIPKCLSGREMKDCRCRCFDYGRQVFRERKIHCPVQERAAVRKQHASTQSRRRSMRVSVSFSRQTISDFLSGSIHSLC